MDEIKGFHSIHVNLTQTFKMDEINGSEFVLQLLYQSFHQNHK